MQINEIEVGSDYSGVGAFDQALMFLGIPYKTIFACDMDKYARISYTENYGKPDYFPENVYDRKIPKKPLDVYMTSPPCQGFSIAGNRKGSILFLNSHDFIKKNKPRFFIFENVKGLLSHDKTNKKHQYGNTFNKWLQYLGGKSINGNPVLFPHEESVPYHIYHKVLNAKHYGIPQNRERVFIIGIRDDKDNMFAWPKERQLKRNLQDVLEKNVDKKYFLSQKMIKGLMRVDTPFEGKFNPKELDSVYANTLTTKPGQSCTDNFIKVGYINNDTQASKVFDENGLSPNLCAGTHGYANGYVSIGAIRGRDVDNPKLRKPGVKTKQILEINKNETSNTLTTVQKDNVVVISNLKTSKQHTKIIENCKIRRLTPRECFRLMGFPESYKIVVSDTQAYKQAGNSIVKHVLVQIISKLNL